MRTIFFLLLTATGVSAQLSELPPLNNAGGTSSIAPPRETPLVDIPWDAMKQAEVSEDGQMALRIAPEKWRHAETPNFYIHYRRATEAHKVAREIEYDLAVVAQALKAPPSSYSRKSQVFVFQDEAEWQEFITSAKLPEWTASFAVGDDLFLNVRGLDAHSFDSQTLAHETTHAVVARIYGKRRWPLWLNEGFAEYMGGFAQASRKNQRIALFQQPLRSADLTLEELSAIQKYPDSIPEVERLYQSSERLVRFLMTKNPPDKFVAFVDQLINQKTLPEAIVAVYGDKYPSFESFEKDYEKLGQH